MDLKSLSSNWKKLQASGSLKKPDTNLSSIKSTNQKTQQHDGGVKRKWSDHSELSRPQHRSEIRKKRHKMSDAARTAKDFVVRDDPNDSGVAKPDAPVNSDRINEGLAKDVDIGKYLALDCEMVGVGPHPHLESALARVSIVNYNGEQVYDSYVKPKEEVTDWRTHVSGILPKHMIHAKSFEEAQADIALLLKGRTIVGHSVRGDFEALLLDHPKRDIRDTARHPPYRKLAGGGSPKLKILASELLGLNIQAGEHSSIEDARATMLLFKRDKDAFEREHMKKWGPPLPTKKVDAEQADDDASRKSKKKKKKKR